MGVGKRSFSVVRLLDTGKEQDAGGDPTEVILFPLSREASFSSSFMGDDRKRSSRLVRKFLAGSVPKSEEDSSVNS